MRLLCVQGPNSKCHFSIFLILCVRNMPLTPILTILTPNTSNGLKHSQTRMHSSGMRTARLLTTSQHALCGGMCLPGGVSARGRLPVDRQTPVKT